MGSKKHIDKFFQEQFKDFEANPPLHVWDNITREIEKDNQTKKRIIPLWIKVGGVAASLIFLIALSVSQFSSENTVNDNVVNEQTIFDNQNFNSESPVVNTIVKDDNVSDLLNQNNELRSIKSNSIPLNQIEKNVGQSKYTVVNSSDSNLRSIENSNNKIKTNKGDFTEKQVANNLMTTQQKSEGYNDVISKERVKSVGLKDEVLVDNQLSDSKNKEDLLIKETTLSNNVVSKNSLPREGDNFNKDNTDIANQFKITPNLQEGVYDDSAQLLPSVNESVYVNKSDNKLQNSDLDNDLKSNINSNVVVNSENENFVNAFDQAENKLRISKDIDAISNVAQKSVNNEEGSVAANELNTEVKHLIIDENCIDEESEELLVEKTIEEAIAEQELKKDETNDEEVPEAYKKWKIVPNVAPVYYNSLTSGSPIADDFKENKKKGKFTASYGIGVGYALNKRLSVRTGVNMLEVGYDTQDVAIYSSQETTGDQHLKNINFSSQGAKMNIAGLDTYSSSLMPSSLSSLFDSNLSQRFGYLEVPLELSYQLSDKKLRVDLVAGVSTFFLNKNEIYAENKTGAIYIGEANNLNNMSYSTNLGIGLEYKISKKLNFNFDPMFKYQLNAFSNDSGNFRPYILGVYSGLSYNF